MKEDKYFTAPASINNGIRDVPWEEYKTNPQKCMREGMEVEGDSMDLQSDTESRMGEGV